ncbi:hypothetical protein PHMEG_0002598 [Phytophthora megakarya]|uniref:Uncharacterized protein n=1 Tax=Phytophthora megakarya TaxID=4795 RepID=A0A225WXX0_9STRA|nr:hypothetical protein PHMEG_0002598 [Phytophthora megakarya]
MSRALPWIELAVGLTEADADLILESLKTYRITRIAQAPCSVCTDPVPHNMRKRILLCTCKQCKLVILYSHCPWQDKQLKCERQKLGDLFQLAPHVTSRREQSLPRLTRAMKGFDQEMADQCLNPARIRTGLMRKFELNASSVLSLKTVQRFVNNYKAAQLGGNDGIDDLQRLKADANGRPYLGNGSDANPFFVGISTKARLRQAARDPGSFMLHIDAAFKLTQVDYSVFVVGLLY